MTSCPASAASMASSLVVHASPDATPGQAGTPVASGGPDARPPAWSACTASELRGRHPVQHPAVVDDALVPERQRQQHRRPRRPLRHPRLQQPQRARLDGELDVLHVGPGTFQSPARLDQLVVHLGEAVPQRAERARSRWCPRRRRRPARRAATRRRGRRAPVDGSRVNSTPVPEPASRLPNTIACNRTATPPPGPARGAPGRRPPGSTTTRTTTASMRAAQLR